MTGLIAICSASKTEGVGIGTSYSGRRHGGKPTLHPHRQTGRPAPPEGNFEFVIRCLQQVVLLLLTAGLLTGCNIMRGVGQDMAATGRTLARVADPGQGSGDNRSSTDTSDAASAQSSNDYDYAWQD
jgi:predicted small secreted protein